MALQEKVVFMRPKSLLRVRSTIKIVVQYHIGSIYVTAPSD